MDMQTLTPQDARQKLTMGALLIDVRSPDEFNREHIAQARSVPMERLSNDGLADIPEAGVIFYCRSGNRTRFGAQTLAASVQGAQAYTLEGGLDGWKKAGQSVAIDKTQPLELSRQVQIGASSLILLGVLLTVLFSPWFILIPAGVGCGLMVAGTTGFCGMARLLMKMPWNRHVVTGATKQ